MQKTWNWKSAIRQLAACVLAFAAVILLAEMWGAWTAPDDYPFGAEGPAAAMWSYRSQANYLFACLSLSLSSLLAIWALLARHHGTRLRWMCAVPLFISWALMAVDGARLTS